MIYKGELGEKDHIMCGILSGPTPTSLALVSNVCPITLRRIQEQGSAVLADNISSDVNGILLVFGATQKLL